jgi:hypothetical protein
MVKAVQAYEADDGRVFPTEPEAAKHDAACALKKLQIFNEATQLAVLEHAEAIYFALGVYVKTLPPRGELQDTQSRLPNTIYRVAAPGETVIGHRHPGDPC